MLARLEMRLVYGGSLTSRHTNRPSCPPTPPSRCAFAPPGNTFWSASRHLIRPLIARDTFMYFHVLPCAGGSPQVVHVRRRALRPLPEPRQQGGPNHDSPTPPPLPPPTPIHIHTQTFKWVNDRLSIQHENDVCNAVLPSAPHPLPHRTAAYTPFDPAFTPTRPHSHPPAPTHPPAVSTSTRTGLPRPSAASTRRSRPRTSRSRSKVEM